VNPAIRVHPYFWQEMSGFEDVDFLPIISITGSVIFGFLTRFPTPTGIINYV
jgi:hypothetical protein